MKFLQNLNGLMPAPGSRKARIIEAHKRRRMRGDRINIPARPASNGLPAPFDRLTPQQLARVLVVWLAFIQQQARHDRPVLLLDELAKPGTWQARARRLVNWAAKRSPHHDWLWNQMTDALLDSETGAWLSEIRRDYKRRVRMEHGKSNFPTRED